MRPREASVPVHLRFDRALAGDADELREGLRRLRTFAEQI